MHFWVVTFIAIYKLLKATLEKNEMPSYAKYVLLSFYVEAMTVPYLDHFDKLFLKSLSAR